MELTGNTSSLDPENIKNLHPETILSRTKEILQEYGWKQGSSGNTCDGFCIMTYTIMIIANVLFFITLTAKIPTDPPKKKDKQQKLALAKVYGNV